MLLEFSDVRLAFGVSDEYSFVLHKDTVLYGTLLAGGPSVQHVRLPPCGAPAPLGPAQLHKLRVLA